MMKQLLLLTGLLLVVFNTKAQLWDFSEPQKLVGDVNTAADETMPVFSKDSSILYFTRLLDASNTGSQYDQDIWMSKRDESGKYTNCEKVSGVNNKFKNAVVGLSTDGKAIYLLDSYEGKKDMKKGIAQSFKNGRVWTFPNHVNIPNLDIEGNFYGFHVAEAENIILISYNGPGSIGQEDLYVSKRSGNDWSTPIHLGNVINTIGYEISPFLSKTQDTLFYSTNGLGGYGDADIFYSIRLDESWANWSKPRNLGARINSSRFDAYFSYSGNNVFWTSNRDELGRDDIYFATKKNFPKLEVDAKGSEVSHYNSTDGKVTVNVKGGVMPYTYQWSNGDTLKDVSGLSPGEYTLIVTDAIGQKSTINVTVQQAGFKAGDDIAKLLTPNVTIFFGLGSWDITKESASELDRVVAIMNEYPNLVIELGSHTDCRSKADFNLRLSQNRAAASAEYIKARIKNPARIYGKGYGESRLQVNCPCEGPVVSSCPEDQHQLNRRTEFIVKSNEASKIPKVDNVTPKIIDYKKDPKYKKLKESGGIAPKIETVSVTISEDQKMNIQNGFYIVQKGETLYRISKNTGVSVEDLQKFNNLVGNEVKVSQKLILKL